MIRRLGAHEAELLRELRLRALAGTPAAFGSTLDRESAFADDVWRDRVSANTSPVFVWDHKGEAVGLAWALLGPEPLSVQLVGMWVAPDARGGPAADALVGAVIDCARRRGATDVCLWVVADNLRARRVYERNGFVPTGHTEVRERDAVAEIEMCRRLG